MLFFSRVRVWVFVFLFFCFFGFARKRDFFLFFGVFVLFWVFFSFFFFCFFCFCFCFSRVRAKSCLGLFFAVAQAKPEIPSLGAGPQWAVIKTTQIGPRCAIIELKERRKTARPGRPNQRGDAGRSFGRASRTPGLPPEPAPAPASAGNPHSGLASHPPLPSPPPVSGPARPP